MSQKEFQRVKVIENAADGNLSLREASRLLNRRYRSDSVDWVPRRRGPRTIAQLDGNMRIDRGDALLNALLSSARRVLPTPPCTDYFGRRKEKTRCRVFPTSPAGPALAALT